MWSASFRVGKPALAGVGRGLRACWQSARGRDAEAFWSASRRRSQPICRYWQDRRRTCGPKRPRPKGLVEMAIWCVEALADIDISASTFSCQLSHFVPNPGSRDERQHALVADRYANADL